MAAWTRLENSPLWGDACAAHDIPIGRHYHNMSHVRRLYHHAEVTFALPYCPDLDHAILAHDVVYDGRPDEVARSVEWLEMRGALNKTREALIMSTQSHRTGDDNRLIILDLADFLYPRIALKNTDRLAREALSLKGQSRTEFLSGSEAYLQSLIVNLQSGIRLAQPFERPAIRKISGGISIVIDEIRYALSDAAHAAHHHPG